MHQYHVIRQWKYQRLDGSSNREDRIRSLQQFNRPDSTDFAFLLSTR